MSLKIEQRLGNLKFTEMKPKIYTTGAFLVPMKIKVGDNERFVWVVEEFREDTYLDGNLRSPILYSDNPQTLLQK
jgi:hypothetical protein